MSDSPFPRSGYAAHRSPSAFAAAIAVNGGVFALLLAIPAAEIIKDVYRPIYVTNVPLRTPPPETKPEPKQNQKPTQAVIPRPQPADPVVPPLVETGGFTAGIVEPFRPVDPGKGILPYDPAPPPPSVFTKARFNQRFADSFKPDYPPALRREGLEGSVTVRVTIDERGRVTAVEMIRATDPRFFAETREQALRYWRFEPAQRDGVAVVSDQTLTVHFKLEE